MSGPIVRSGASPLFSENWDRIFSKGKSGKAAAKGKKAASKKVSPKLKPAGKKSSAKSKKKK